METNFNFKSQIVTSREQSERLLALGLKKETADMRRPHYNEHCPWVIDKEDCLNEHWLPAWSLHRLIEMMPFDIWHTEYEDSPHLRHTFYFSKYAPSYNSYEDIDFRAHPTLYDNIIDCIEWLIKEGYFPKEYLV